MATPHAHTLATHLINQTLSSIATLESLSVISASDAQLIRSKLPPPNGPFPSLHAAQQNQSGSFGQMNVSGGAASSPYGGQQPQQYPSPPSHQMQPHSSGSVVPALPPRGKPESRARALWDYSGTEADDLAFRANDTIIIDEEVNEQWYRGRVIPQGQTYALDRSGLFPSNYIEKIQTNSQFPPPQPQAVVPYQTQGPPAPYGGGYQDQKHDQQYQVMPPPHPQHQQLQHQNSSTTVVAQQDPHKPNKFGKLGSKLGDSAVHGAGFGFGASIASNLVNKIF